MTDFMSHLLTYLLTFDYYHRSILATLQLCLCSAF